MLKSVKSMNYSRGIQNICKADSSLPVFAAERQKSPELRAETSKRLTYCAPVTAAKTLVARVLADKSLKELLPRQNPYEDEKSFISRLIEDLAELMGTENRLKHPEPGTSMEQYIAGLEKFLAKTGFKLTADSCVFGRLSVDAKVQVLPDICAEELRTELKNLARDYSANLGWYLNPESNLFERQGGHFIAFDGVDGKTISLQDPSPRAQNKLTSPVYAEDLSAQFFDKKNNSLFEASLAKLDGVATREYQRKDKLVKSIAVLDSLFKWGVEKDTSRPKRPTRRYRQNVPCNFGTALPAQ